MRKVVGHTSRRHVTNTVNRPRLWAQSFARPFATTAVRHTAPTEEHDPVAAKYVANLSKITPPLNPHARSIAVLGGGLTGLATAFYLTRQLPDAKITIYDKSERIGGWVNSEVVKVDDGEALFEWGPRTIRVGTGPATESMLELIGALNLDEDLIAIPKSAPAARNRYIYYPDHLVKMPVPWKGSSLSEWLSTWSNMFTEPLYEGLIPGVLKEIGKSLRDESVDDESLGDFISRRFDRHIADNLLSAVCHGIYAGDVYKLSARTLQPTLWYLETRHRDVKPGILGEYLHNMFNQKSIYPQSRTRDMDRIGIELANFVVLGKGYASPRLPRMDRFKDISVLTFRHGLGQLTAALAQNLHENNKVTLSSSSAVEEVVKDKSRRQLAVKYHRNELTETTNHDYVVSTLAPQHLVTYLEANNHKDSSATLDPKVISACQHSNGSVTVMVVNLYYSNPDLLPPSTRGFGYLIPRSVPAEQNPERALGVIFSSETSGLLDPLDLRSMPSLFRDNTPEGRGGYQPKFVSSRDLTANSDIVAQDSVPGTKLTVMMGGHWWADWAEGDIPTEARAVEMARSLLKRHLDIEEEPAVAQARLNKDCIPMYPVGYSQDMATIHDALIDMYDGRFKVAGPWWQGAPGMNDCVLNARRTAWAIRDNADEVTGLQDYTKDRWTVLHTPSQTFETEHSS